MLGGAVVVRDPWPGAPLFECTAVEGALLDIERRPDSRHQSHVQLCGIYTRQQKRGPQA